MKSLLSLWSRLAEESASLCCISATRDLTTVSRRIEHEGLSFLTITLPDFGKAIQTWLDQGQVGIYPAFRKERGGSLPRFLGGFFNRVFDRSSGLLLEDPCIEAIIALRQLTLMFGKMELECSQERQAAAVRGYLQNEQDVRQFDMRLSQSDLREFTDMSNLLFGSLFTQMDRDVYYGEVVPKHGPGSTADKLSSNGKYRQRTWTRRLETVFPVSDHLIPNHRWYSELDEVDVLEPGEELPVRVALVPKTMKTPRVIAMEPACMQFMQQAIYGSFIERFARDRLLTKLLGFDDQVPNQELARQGSLDKRTATLDLSDASDRVSNQLVRAMFTRWPHLGGAVDATRSRRAVLPGSDKVIRLAKFASMGSALCFPVEAMVFLTVCLVGIQRSLNKPLSRRDLQGLAGSVRIYGDDIIVPTEHVLSVIQALTHFGAKVGLDKSFWSGNFRESCGREYFNGHDVSITRVRQEFPTSRQDATCVISLVSLRNQLYMSGYWRTVKWLEETLRSVIRHFPNVDSSSQVLGRICSLGYQAVGLHADTHSPVVRGYVTVADPPRDDLGGVGALHKCLLMLDSAAHTRAYMPWLPPDASLSGPFAVTHDSTLWVSPPKGYEKHLERSGRPKRVSIKLGWRRPY